MTEEKKAEEAKKEVAKEEKPAEKAPKESPKEAKVNYVHAALLLHSAGKEITEASLKKIIDATGTKSDEAQVKALVANLEGVDIEEAISHAVAAPVAAPAAAAEAPKEEKKEENVEKKAEEAAAGLSSLFG